MGWCPNCGHETVDLPLPVEPLYGAENAAAMIPCTRGALQQAARRHPHLVGPPLYRWWRGKRYRMYRASDIRGLRDYMVTGERYPWTKSRKERHGIVERQAAPSEEGTDPPAPGVE